MHPLWAEFRAALGQPEYIHVLLNPLPIYGLAVAVAGLAAALLTGRRGAQAIALILIALTAASAGPAAHFGHQGYDRVYSLSDAPAQKWLNWHAHLAERIVWLYYAAAAIACLAAAALRRPSGLQRPLGLIALAAALAALAGGAFLGFVGGKIRHSEFRDSAPPAWANTSDD
jgi:hypothetical protein